MSNKHLATTARTLKRQQTRQRRQAKRQTLCDQITGRSHWSHWSPTIDPLIIDAIAQQAAHDVTKWAHATGALPKHLIVSPPTKDLP